MEYASWPVEQPSTQTRTGLVAALLEELGKDLALENVESVRVAEKTRHADENVGVEGVEFLGVAAKEICIVLQGVLFVQHHAPGDAALDGGGFVEGEIHAGMIAEKQKNFFETVLSRFCIPRLSFGARGLRTRWRSSVAARRQRSFIVLVRRRGRPVVFRGVAFMTLTRDVGMLRNAGELFGDVLRLENEIHAARRNRAARHRVVLRRIILRERNPALGFDGLHAHRAVGCRAGKNHSDGALALVLRQGFKKRINGTSRRAALLARLKFQNTLRDAEIRVGRNDINVVGFHAQIIRDLAHRH